MLSVPQTASLGKLMGHVEHNRSPSAAIDAIAIPYHIERFNSHASIVQVLGNVEDIPLCNRMLSTLQFNVLCVRGLHHIFHIQAAEPTILVEVISSDDSIIHFNQVSKKLSLQSQCCFVDWIANYTF